MAREVFFDLAWMVSLLFVELSWLKECFANVRCGFINSDPVVSDVVGWCSWRSVFIK